MVHRVLDFEADDGVFAVGKVLAFPDLRVARAAGGADHATPRIEGAVVRDDLRTLRQLTALEMGSVDFRWRRRRRCRTFRRNLRLQSQGIL